MRDLPSLVQYFCCISHHINAFWDFLQCQVEQEIALQDQAILQLKDAIAAQDPPLRLATTRLEKRTLRPNVELVTDSAHHALVKEVKDIDASLEHLHTRLAQNEDAMKGLLRNKLALEKDIAVKNTSISLDTECTEHRKQLGEN